MKKPRKGKDPDFDYKRIAFVQEAAGKQAEDLVQSAQSNVQNARRASMQAAYNLFITSLQNDTVLHEKHLAASDVNSQRARSVLVGSLQARWEKEPQVWIPQKCWVSALGVPTLLYFSIYYAMMVSNDKFND